MLMHKGLIHRGRFIHKGGLYTEGCIHRGHIYRGHTYAQGAYRQGEVYTQGRSGLHMGWYTIAAKELIWLIRNLYCDYFTIPSRPRSVEEVFDGWS